MKHIKKVIAGIVIVLLLVAAAVEGRQLQRQAVPTPVKQTAAAEKTIITVWTKDRHDLEFYTKKIEKFNAENKDNIVVEYKVFSDNYTQAVDNTFYSSAPEPDMLVFTSKIFTADTESRYADITPYMDEEFKNTFASVMVENLNLFDGKCYYVPTCATTCRLFYNKTVFNRVGIDHPPATMEEMIDDARKITDALSGEGIYGFAVNMRAPDAALNRSFMKQGNIQLGIKSGYDFKEGRYDFTRYGSLIRSWKVLMSSECVYPGSKDLAIDPLRKLFSEGKIGMYMSYSHSEFGAYLNQYRMVDEWACAKLPTVGGVETGAQNYSLNNGFLFNKESKNLDKAWIVYRSIFANVENMKEYHAQGLGISVIPEVINSTDLNSDVLKYPELLVRSDERIWPLTPNEVNEEEIDVVGTELYQTLRNLIVFNGDIDSELQLLTDRYNDAYDAAMERGAVERIQYDDFDPKDIKLYKAGE